MGGTMILISMILSIILWANLSNYLVILVLMISTTFGIIGGIDDYKNKISVSSGY